MSKNPRAVFAIEGVDQAVDQRLVEGLEEGVVIVGLPGPAVVQEYGRILWNDGIQVVLRLQMNMRCRRSMKLGEQH